MDIEFEFYATLQDAAGGKTATLSTSDGTTVETALHEIATDYDALEPLLFSSDGELRPHLTVARNDQPLFEGRQSVVLEDGDTLVISPGVSGGTTAAVTEVLR